MLRLDDFSVIDPLNPWYQAPLHFNSNLLLATSLTQRRLILGNEPLGIPF